MEISKSIEQKYLHAMAIDQLIVDYSRLGYQVVQEEAIGQYRPDLIARKDNETIIFEVKTGQMNAELRQKLTAFSSYVKSTPNHRFRVVFATPPQTKVIEIENLGGVLLDYFTQAEIPDALDTLSSNTGIENVSDLAISRISVLPNGELELSGTGVFEVVLRYGGSDGAELEDAYPFEFNAIVFHDGESWHIADLTRCAVDTSSFSQ